MQTLGIQLDTHPAAAFFSNDGNLCFCKEEWLTKKIDPHAFPSQAITYCIKNIPLEELDAIVIAHKPFLRIERNLFSLMADWPQSLKSFPSLLNHWLSARVNLPKLLRQQLNYRGKVLYCHHPMAQLVSSYALSPFAKGAFLSLNNKGERYNVAIGKVEEQRLEITKGLNFPNSLVHFYYGMAQFLEISAEEMHTFSSAQTCYFSRLHKEVITATDDGSFSINPALFYFTDPAMLINRAALSKLFPFAKREISEFAASVNYIKEMILRNILNTLQHACTSKNLLLHSCLPIARQTITNYFPNLYHNPFIDDTDAAIGAAIWGAWELNPKIQMQKPLSFQWGPEYSDQDIESFLHRIEVPFTHLSEESINQKVQNALNLNQKVAFYRGCFNPDILDARKIVYKHANTVTSVPLQFADGTSVFSPQDAYRLFLLKKIDVLFLNSYVVEQDQTRKSFC